jgi:transcriptional regulator with PAS, ATPase and Fis domain
MRLFPRITPELAVILNGRLAGSKAMLSSLSLGGAFLRGPFPTVKIGDSLFMKYHLPSHGLFESSGKAVRKDTEGVAVQFYDLDSSSKIKLWEYIADGLKNLHACPYCGHSYEGLPQACARCGWNLDFHSPVYLEYHQKTCMLKRLHSKAEKLSADQLRRVVDLLAPEFSRQPSADLFPEFVGTSQAMKKVYVKIQRVAPTDVPVLLLGESGTGKELTALAIHERSKRKDEAFITINCAAIPENLLEAELFGYEKGSYTGAHTRKIGKFEYADGGTLFLDEIAELPPALQAKILRFLDNQMIERIGTVTGKKINVRFIAATNCDLQAALSRGRFRPDLFYRLEAFTIKLPPVRERRGDILLLAQSFLRKFSREIGVIRDFSPEALEAMGIYAWPGNVREMANKIRKALILGSDHFLKPRDLDLPDMTVSGPGEESAAGGNGRGKIEKQKVMETLEQCRHNISSTAKILGVSRPTVYHLKRKFGI